MRCVSRPRALVIEHEPDAPAGLVSEWLEHHDVEVDELAIAEAADHDPAHEYRLIVSLGSERSAYDDELSWLSRELALLRDAIAADTPVLGICFGCQLLARALGGRVFRAAQPEIGWLEVDSDCAELIARGPWFQWHFDTFSPPSSASLLARSEAGPQAFVQGRNIGIQFHPEVDSDIVAGWARNAPHELEQHGVDPAQLLAQTDAMARAARAASWELLEGCRKRLALF